MARIVVALLSLAALGSAHPALAQRRELTVLGGGNLSGATGPNLFRGQTRAGFVGGLSLRLPRTPRFSVQTELLIARHQLFGQRAATTQPPLQAGLLADEAQLLSLEIPVLLRFQRGYSQLLPVRPFMVLGPYIGVRLNCRREVTESNGNKHITDCTVASGSFGSETVLPAVYQEVDVGLLAGLGVEIHRVALGARFQRSFRNLVEPQGGIHTSPFDGSRLWVATVTAEFLIRVI